MIIYCIYYFQGDMGGPLACPSLADGKYLLVGGLSGGVACMAEGVPDIFSSYVGGVQEWVHRELKERWGVLKKN